MPAHEKENTHTRIARWWKVFVVFMAVPASIAILAISSLSGCESLGGSISRAVVDRDPPPANHAACATLKQDRALAERAAEKNAHSLVDLMRDQRWQQKDQQKYLIVAKNQTEQTIAENRQIARTAQHLLAMNCDSPGR